MRLVRPFIIGSRTLTTLARLGFDSVAEPFGGALPLSPERVSTPEFLNGLLRDHGIDPQAAKARIADTRLLDIKSVSSNCNNVVVAIAQEADASVADAGAFPDSLFIKLPSAQILTRAFCSIIGVWGIECDFYRHVAARVPIRVPKPYVVVSRGTRFILGLEDLHADPEVRLFTNPDMMEGPSLELVERCLSALARVHASFSGLSTRERDAMLPLTAHPFMSKHMREISRALNLMAVEPCRKITPHLLTDQLVALFKRGIAQWELLIDWWFQEPLTLIHGDSHLGNFFVSGNEMGMLDWQAAQWGKGIRDVQYMLIDSVPAEILAAHEKDLVRYYLSELEANGVTLGFEDAWEQYRAYSFQTFMTIVVSIGLGAMTERLDVMEEILARSIAAIERLQFGEWLDGLQS